MIVAIVGKAAEHSTAVTIALKNKMDLLLSIVIGSSLPIALFLTPVWVFSSYLFAHRLDLEFLLREVGSVVLAAFVTGKIAANGESERLEGVQLLALHLVVGVLISLCRGRHRLL